MAERETLDTLYYRQQDTTKFPAWIMNLSEKRAELRVFFFRVTRMPAACPKVNDEWWPEWLVDDISDKIHDSLSYYLLRNEVIPKEMVTKK